jgi:site-specific DNA-methyltransferase (adenine-specific)
MRNSDLPPINFQLLHGDCMALMEMLPDQSVDLVLCDLPYGTTACKWDSVLPFEALWAEYRRIAKPNAAIVLTAAQPFTSALVMSNRAMFRYSLVWDKVNKYTGYANANRMPLRRHEDILVFYGRLPVFNKQMVAGVSYKYSRRKNTEAHMGANGLTDRTGGSETGERNPFSIISIKGDNKKEAGLHPTQKPVELMDYLVRTYSDPGQIVLDNCMGSGTTGVAAIGAGRRFIGIEKDERYFATAQRRIEEAWLLS